MFIDTCTIPRSFRAKPFARTYFSPPLDSRIACAIFFATWMSGVPRFTLNAISGARAPTTLAPAVGWSCLGPKSGARSGVVLISSRGPLDPPLPDVRQRPSLRPRRSLLIEVHGDLQLPRDALADRAGNRDAFLHRDPRYGDERAHVERADPRMLAPVDREVDQRDGLLGAAERGLCDRLPVPDERDHRAVVVRAHPAG